MIGDSKKDRRTDDIVQVSSFNATLTLPRSKKPNNDNGNPPDKFGWILYRPSTLSHFPPFLRIWREVIVALEFPCSLQRNRSIAPIILFRSRPSRFLNYINPIDALTAIKTSKFIRSPKLFNFVQGVRFRSILQPVNNASHPKYLPKKNHVDTLVF